MSQRACTTRRGLRRLFVLLGAFALLLLPMAACTFSYNPPYNSGNYGQGITQSVQVVYGANGATMVLIQVQIHGQGPFTFALDTGASTSVISTSLAKQLGLQYTGNSQWLSGIGGGVQAEFVNISDWNSGEIRLPSVSIASADISSGDNTHFDGLLGSDILNRFGKFTLDYGSSTFTVYQQIALAPDEPLAWLARRKVTEAEYERARSIKKLAQRFHVSADLFL